MGVSVHIPGEDMHIPGEDMHVPGEDMHVPGEDMHVPGEDMHGEDMHASSVHIPGEDQRRRACLDGHACHLEPLRLRESREVLSLDPFRDEDLLGRVLLDDEGHAHEAQKGERVLEAHRILRLLLVVELV